jgi:uncharacterized protein (TIGR03083 family)
MMLDRRWLLGVARHEREMLGRTVQYTPLEAWERESPNEGWRVKDVVAHLAASDVAAAAVLGDEAPSELEEYRKSLEGRPVTGDGWNDWSVDRRRDIPARQLALEWGRAADLFLARATKLTEEDWERRVPWTVGDLKAAYLVQLRNSEWWLHGEDVLEGGGLPPRMEHWPIVCVNDLAVRLLPYSLGLEGKSFPGRSVLVDLEGPGEGTWRRALAPREEDPTGRYADAVISGRGYAFAYVAGKRADPDVCLYEGLLQVGGDVDLAHEVLRALRSFP